MIPHAVKYSLHEVRFPSVWATKQKGFVITWGFFYKYFVLYSDVMSLNSTYVLHMQSLDVKILYN